MSAFHLKLSTNLLQGMPPLSKRQKTLRGAHVRRFLETIPQATIASFFQHVVNVENRFDRYDNADVELNVDGEDPDDFVIENVTVS